jgi:hypothetical protein
MLIFRMPHRQQGLFHTKDARVLRVQTGRFPKPFHLFSENVLSKTSTFLQNTQLPVEISATHSITSTYKYFNLLTSSFYWLLIINPIPVLMYVVCLKRSVNGTRKQTQEKIQTNSLYWPSTYSPSFTTHFW